LLDTNVILFWLGGSPRLGEAIHGEITDRRNDIFVSSISGFEIAVKAGLGRLTLPGTPGAVLPPFFDQAGLTELPVTMAHSLAVYDLPPLHADPFDRLLVAQASVEKLVLITSDRILGDYDIPVKLVR
jgi:PIN domain nuclease of toxin-antitoxin system